MNEAWQAFLAAHRMANLCFNLKQRDTPPTQEEWERYRKIMAGDQSEWDAGSSLIRQVLHKEGFVK